MAEEVAYKIIVESDLANKSVGELKQDFKDLTDQINKTKVGSEQYKQTLSSLGVVKGGLQDLKQQIQALNPEKTVAAFAKVGSTVASGFAAGQAAVALFGGESEDLMKVLVKVQAATALASGIQGLTGMVKALETAGLAMKAFALSNPFTAIAAGVTILVASIYGIVQAFDDSKEKADKLRTSNENLETSMKNLKEETALTEREMKALGKSEQEIFESRQRFRDIEIAGIQEEIENINKLQRAGTITEEDLKKRNELEDRLSALRRTKKVEGLEFTKKIAEEELDADIKTTQKQLDFDNETDAIEKKRREDAETKRKEDFDKFQKDLDDRVKAKDIYNAAVADEEKALQLKAFVLQEEVNKTFDAIAVAEEKKKLQDEQDAKDRIDLELSVLNAKLDFAKQSFAVIGQLADAFAGKNERSAKRAFEINKAASIAQAVISTYQGANAIFAAAALNPATVLFPAQPFIAAGLAIAAGIANVVKISKTQFQGGAISDSGGSVPNLGGGGSSNAEAPSFKPTPSTGVNKDEQGDFKSFQNTQPMKVYVLENDITSTQKTVARIEQNAKY